MSYKPKLVVVVVEVAVPVPLLTINFFVVVWPLLLQVCSWQWMLIPCPVNNVWEIRTNGTLFVRRPCQFSAYKIASGCCSLGVNGRVFFFLWTELGHLIQQNTCMYWCCTTHTCTHGTLLQSPVWYLFLMSLFPLCVFNSKLRLTLGHSLTTHRFSLTNTFAF